jgi:hypothetical protein
VTVQIPDPLIAALRSAYPRCLPDSGAIGEFVSAIVTTHLRTVTRVSRALEEFTPVPDSELTPEPRRTPPPAN